MNAVDRSIGGVLLRGEKGTGKTTAGRSFAAVLSPKDVVSGCRFCCVRGTLLSDGAGPARRRMCGTSPDRWRWWTLALNASGDRRGEPGPGSGVAGGDRKVEMGVLGKANGNVLYIDKWTSWMTTWWTFCWTWRCRG